MVEMQSQYSIPKMKGGALDSGDEQKCLNMLVPLLCTDYICSAVLKKTTKNDSILRILPRTYIATDDFDSGWGLGLGKSACKPVHFPDWVEYTIISDRSSH